jgi:ABC-2 type transport system permease protein
MRVLSVAWSHVRICIANEMQYRVNFFLQLLQSLIGLAVGLVSLALVFRYTSQLGGWTRPDLLIVMGIYIAVGGFISALIQPNMERLLWEIHHGGLDFALVKPVDSQVMASVRDVRFWSFTDVVTGLIVVGVGIAQLGSGTTAWNVLSFACTLLFGCIQIYSFWLIITSMAFWVVRLGDMFMIFSAVYGAGRWPVNIYPSWLRILLTFLVPVAFAITVPAEALTGRLSPLALLGAAGMTALFAMLARVIWLRAVRHYSGASA